MLFLLLNLSRNNNYFLVVPYAIKLTVPCSILRSRGDSLL